jgi:hypothetical protein
VRERQQRSGRELQQAVRMLDVIVGVGEKRVRLRIVQHVSFW